MSLTPWTDRRKPSPGDTVLREDGRVCRVKGYASLMAKNPTSNGPTPRMGALGAAELPPTQAGMLLDYPPVVSVCGEEIPPRMVSMCVFWPTVIPAPLSCTKCMEAP